MKRIPRSIRLCLLALLLTGTITAVMYAARRFWPATASEVRPLTMSIQPRDFTIRISANGELESSESMTIAVPFVPVQKLRIASVVADGRHVNKGDVLVEFDPTELDLEMLEHRSSLEMANQKITRGQLAVGTEKTDISKDRLIAELELQKINEFLPRDEQIYSRRQIIEGQLDKDLTEKKLVFADARLQLKGKVYSLDEAILLLERKQADSKINQVERALTSLKLISPASGIIVYTNPDFFFGGFSIQPGRTVWIGQTLFNLVNPDKMQAKCFVLEKDAGELRKDQPVKISLDPFPGVEFQGRIKSIDNLARPIDRDSPVKYFQTVVTFDKNDPNLMKPGVKLKAEIQAGDVKSALVVPRSAVVKKENDFIIHTLTSPGVYQSQKVKLGQGDLIQVVITEGLRAGQIIALNPPDVRREPKDKQKKSE
jgi:RND family efflux transporter MFP subunit